MKEKILILGASGMVGHTLFTLMQKRGFEVYGTTRNIEKLPLNFIETFWGTLYQVNRIEDIFQLINNLRPTILINAIGLIKQTKCAFASEYVIINSYLPCKLAELFSNSMRIIHFSTDCVFDGKKGNYTEKDNPNATDIYGKTKAIGEIIYKNCLTLRLSVIGHEIKDKKNLLEWFLNLPENSTIKGYGKAIFSGITTVELEKVLSEIILPNKEIEGLYHISSLPISKYDLLTLVKNIYNKNIKIEKDEDFTIDRSLNSEKFKKEFGYSFPSWENMIKNLYDYYKKYIFIYS